MMLFPNLRQDLVTYNGDAFCQGFWIMVVYRFGRWRYSIATSVIRKPISLLYKIAFKLVQIVTGVELPCEVPIGKNFIIDHFGSIIVSGYASFGDNCRIRPGVVIGLKNIQQKKAPRIGNNVDIGAGAKILGDITIGDNVLIGANAVVLCDVPPNSIAVGVPARILEARNNAAY